MGDDPSKTDGVSPWVPLAQLTLAVVWKAARAVCGMRLPGPGLRASDFGDSALATLNLRRHCRPRETGGA